MARRLHLSPLGGFVTEGDRVRFRIADIFLPAKECLEIAGQQEMEGVIVQFSDSGDTPKMFASVDLLIHQIVIVPTDRLCAIVPSP